MTFDFSNKDLFNHVYLPLLSDQNRINILYGSRDSGKSDFIAQKIIISLLEEEFMRLILLRKYYASIKSSQFQTIIDYINMWGLQEHFKWNVSPLFIECKLNGNQVLARGLDKPDNTKSIKDPTAIWYEEADQISEEAFTEASLSLRSSRAVNLKEYISFNPRREQSWINRRFFPNKASYENPEGRFHFVKSIQPNVTILHTHYRDNRFCSPERALNLELLQNIDENLYKVNALGLWGGALKGLVYTHWKITDEFPNGDTVFGLDYGYNNATALVEVRYCDKELYIKQHIYQTKLTHADVIHQISNEFRSIIGSHPIYVDSAEPALIKELKKAGFIAKPAVKGSNSVYEGIIKCKELAWNIHSDSINILEEVESYIWKRDSDDNATDQPVKIDDHAMDAIRYVVHTYGTKYWLRSQGKTSKRLRQKRERTSFSNF